jgi:L-lactate dehydrogenase complex protein LldG
MSSRESILNNIRANRPPGEHPLPAPPDFPSDYGGDLVKQFLKQLQSMGGRAYTGAIDAAIRDLFPNAKVIASTVPEFTGDRVVTKGVDPRELADIDVAITRAALGVAETGSVLLVDEALISNAVAYLAQHLIVLLDPSCIVPGLQDAYRLPDMHKHRYASFHTGPSATADIDGVLVHGAQGVRSLTVLLT